MNDVTHYRVPPGYTLIGYADDRDTPMATGTDYDTGGGSVPSRAAREAKLLQIETYLQPLLGITNAIRRPSQRHPEKQKPVRCMETGLVFRSQQDAAIALAAETGAAYHTAYNMISRCVRTGAAWREKHWQRISPSTPAKRATVAARPPARGFTSTAKEQI